MSNATIIKGRGYIRFTTALWEAVGKPETAAEWRKVFLLPDSYEIERIERVNYQDVRGEVFNLFVQHAAIPIISDYEPMPEVTPHYAKLEQGNVVLTRIEIRQWSEGAWKQVAVTDEVNHAKV